MSTDYTHFTNLAFTNLFARGADGAETLLVNSSGAFVNINISGNIATTGNITIQRVLTNFAGSAASTTIRVVSAGLGIYRVAAKQMGFAAGGINIATITTAALLVAKAVTATGAVTGSNLSGSNTGDQTISLTGNVTGSGTGSFATTIASSVVTNVMISPTAAIAGTKIVSASSAVSGVMTTGTQSFAGTKTFVTPLTGSNVASASSSASGVVTTGTQSLAGIKTFVTQLIGKGTGAADSAAAGYIGEFTSISTVQSSAKVVTTGSTANIVSSALSITAGDWDLEGSVGFLPSATTSITKLFYGITKTSATLPSGDTSAVPTGGEVRMQFTNNAFVPGDVIEFTIPRTRVSVSSTTSFYLYRRATFTIAGLRVYGSLTARRVR